MSDLQQKLNAFEAIPPEAVWNKIADALETNKEFPHRLYNYELQPPVTLWKSIEDSLHENEPAKVIPFTKRFRKPLRYAAVACIIAVILVTITLTVKRTEAGAPEGKNNEIVSAKKTLPIINKKSQVQERPTPTTAIADVPKPMQEKQKKLIALKPVLRNIRLQNVDEASAVTEKFIPKEASEKELFDFASLNNYMIYSDGDGNAMKLPKKLFSLVSCHDGDGSCKERIQLLRQKLASNTTTPDFVGIIDIIRQLQ